MKICTKCGEGKPLSEYHKRKASKDGLKPSCKSCVKAANKAHYEANRDEIAAWNKAYYEANREKIAAREKARYEANRDEIRASMRAYYQENRDELLAERKAYHEANRDEALARNKAYRADRYANDPEFRARYAAANIRRRRLLDSAVQEPYTREEIFERDGWTCQLCQEPIDSELQYPESGFASIDHIIPISHGGDDTPDNVQAAHLSCNLSKGNRVELEDLQAA